ncbi:accessory Sec system protein Asp2 [Staphylococcus massiliensis]|uniref:Two component regulator three Y domain-containing protein n=1 Tax=Staphylococcus massiliensis S46 TaxID=1229783 RepID=K9AP32_9STAP|nr:accessory Sec system protein Asp2 [Staphylococcus massiliensis]EKU47781.1 hypothetical protein C273_07052 [Staphylococcus massiliensis S46]MCG3399808.1 hypothetical protein [Staphylococcus massiliensis]MCG3401545.1 hypothetical protein [Staphylococcus massiliensis]PNZ96882.1 hypothetical protein CD133_11425 [Staphylococcus massiliensis CCUG 55927]
MDKLKTNIKSIEIPNCDEELRFRFENLETDEIQTLNINSSDKHIEINLDNLQTHFNYRYFFEINTQDGYQVYSKPKHVFPEFIDEDTGIHYSLIKHNQSDKLLVVFSSSTHNNQFNYFNTLKDYKINKLFITDNNSSSSDTTCAYYIGNGNRKFESQTISIIERVLESLAISKDNVYLFGSSKGGFAALYYVFKYRFGNAILGSPTVYLGKMHKDNERGQNIITYITGKSLEEGTKWLDNVITDEMLNSVHKPKLYYHVGEKEPRYTRHAVHFLKLIDETNLASYELDLGDYSNHSDVIHFFPPYAHEVLKNIESN